MAAETTAVEQNEALLSDDETAEADDDSQQQQALADAKVTWMWADAGMCVLGPLAGTLAQQNPLRWSKWRTLEATMNKLAKYRDEQGVKHRGLRLRFKGTEDIMSFETIDDALIELKSESRHKQASERALVPLLQEIKHMGPENDELTAKVAELEKNAQQEAALQAKQDECAQLQEQLQQKEIDLRDADVDTRKVKAERDEFAAKLADIEAELAMIMKANLFEEGEDVFVWSESSQKWEEGVVLKVGAAGSFYEGYCVEAGAIIVEYDRRKKQIPNAHLSNKVRKDPPEETLPSAIGHDRPSFPTDSFGPRPVGDDPELKRKSEERIEEVDKPEEPSEPSVPPEPKVDSENPAEDDINPYDTVQWMWRDAGVSLRRSRSSLVARYNPLRWSDWKQLDATIKELGATNNEDRNRPVRMRTNRKMAMLTFETVDDALRALEEQVKEEEIYSKFSKLYGFVRNAWEEKGTGNAKLMENKSGQVRFMFVQDKTMKILSNHVVVDSDPFCNFLPNENGDLFRVWTAQEYLEKDYKIETVALKFCDPEQAHAFEAQFMKAKRPAKSA